MSTVVRSLCFCAVGLSEPMGSSSSGWACPFMGEGTTRAAIGPAHTAASTGARRAGGAAPHRIKRALGHCVFAACTRGASGHSPITAAICRLQA